jgi:predicted Zn-dependent protease
MTSRVSTATLRSIACAALLLASSLLGAQSRAASPVLRAMKDELTRNFTALRAQPTPAYFLSYEITETRSVTINSSFGALASSSSGKRRQLDLSVRVGDYRFDNTHATRGQFARPEFFSGFSGSAEIPVEDDAPAIRNALWYQTDRQYKRAIEQIAAAKTNAQVAVAAEDSSADYSPAPPESYSEPIVTLDVDRTAWEKRLRTYTAPFARYSDLYDARASLDASVETRWYVNSEGTELQLSQPTYRLFISARSKADDGMELPRYESFFAPTLRGLPSDEAVLKAVDKMIADLHALRVAPVVDPYSGPAILTGKASAVFFHEIFGHRIEGHRQRSETEGQTFKKRVNDKILPDNFSVYFDPTLKQWESHDLAGYYRYDNEGVKARRVAAVENGVFKSFIMSRVPSEGFPASNGHGRKQSGFAPVARQSNLIVQVAQPRTRAELKQMLIDQIKRDNKPFGLLFDDIEGGFTITARFIPNAFNVLPIMVYRVFPDGREQLVRGVDLIGTPLTTFSRIVAADDEIATFNGMCGAESGSVPVSASSPAVFISQIEVQKKIKSQDRPPILGAPLPTRGVPDGGLDR